MSDRLAIDSHKLNYHVSRVNQWLTTGDVYPIYVEVSPAGACNHRCTFCAVDYIGYKTIFLDKEILKNRLKEMGDLGVKSVMFAGEGEPLLHKNLPEVIQYTKESGVDVAITTNAVPLTENWCQEALESVTWIKASVNAGTAETYAKIHKTNAKDFDKVVSNLAFAVTLRNKNKWSCTIGSQMVLLPENTDEFPGAQLLQRLLKDMYESLLFYECKWLERRIEQDDMLSDEEKEAKHDKVEEVYKRLTNPKTNEDDAV